MYALIRALDDFSQIDIKRVTMRNSVISTILSEITFYRMLFTFGAIQIVDEDFSI